MVERFEAYRLCQITLPRDVLAKLFYVEIQASIYFHTLDQLGSIRESTDTARNVIAQYEFDAFGRNRKVSILADYLLDTTITTAAVITSLDGGSMMHL